MPFLLVSPLTASALSARVALLVVAFALVCSAVAYVIYYKLIADVGPTKALTVTFLIPVFAMVWGVLLIGERITVTTAAGALIILVGTFLVTAPRGKAARAAPAAG